jgi:DNA invertase Pin-like site-specific DNA recombinase
MSGNNKDSKQEILNAGIWAAVSSLPQAKLVSLDDQLRLGREHAARHNCRIVAEMVVPGESRDIVLFEEAARRMEAYRQLQQHIEKKTIDVLIFLDRSRLGRQAALSMAIVGLCAKAGILIYDIESPPSSIEQLRQAQSSYDDMLLGAIKSVGAQREIDKFKFRQMNGMIGRTQRGLMPAKPSFGYKVRYETDGAKALPVYEVDAGPAAIVQDVFSLYLSGLGAKSIAYAMTERGEASPSGRAAWTPAMVIGIIRCVWKYAGYAELNKRSKRNRPYIKAKAAWPALIDEATANAVIAERKARGNNRFLVNTPWLLSGVAYCTTCGFPLVIGRQTPTSRHYYDTLRCYRHRPGTYIPYHRVEDVVKAAIAALPEMDLSQLEQRPSNAGRLNRQAAAVQKQLDEIKAAELRADDQYVAGRMTAERYQRQVDALAEKRAKLDADLAALQSERAKTVDKAEQRKRLQTAKEIGLEMLNNPDIPIARKNIWLRQLMIVWVERNQVKQVDWKL